MAAHVADVSSSAVDWLIGRTVVGDRNCVNSLSGGASLFN
jgi:hypothetical protein